MPLWFLLWSMSYLEACCLYFCFKAFSKYLFSLTLLWSENTLFIIQSSFKTTSTWSMTYMHFKRMCLLPLFSGVFYKCWLAQFNWYNSSTFLYSYWFSICSVIYLVNKYQQGCLIADLFVSLFGLVSFCLMDFEAWVWEAYLSCVIKSSFWIDTSVICKISFYFWKCTLPWSLKRLISKLPLQYS